MNKGELKKRHLAAAVAASGIIAAIVVYTAVAEALRHSGYKPPVQPPAAYALKYALYLLGASAVAVLRLAGRALDSKKATPEETAALLTRLAIFKAAVCELPAIAGLILFILTGYYADFYLLIVFSIALEIFNFPRLGQWEERVRGDFGQLPD